MNEKEIISREEDLGNWRSAILLTFNGFLLSAITAEHAGSYIINVVPFLGFFISLSVFVVSLLSCSVKHEALKKSNANVEHYSLKQFFGPYIFSSFLLVVFWVGYKLCA